MDRPAFQSRRLPGQRPGSGCSGGNLPGIGCPRKGRRNRLPRRAAPCGARRRATGPGPDRGSSARRRVAARHLGGHRRRSRDHRDLRPGPGPALQPAPAPGRPLPLSGNRSVLARPVGHRHRGTAAERHSPGPRGRTAPARRMEQGGKGDRNRPHAAGLRRGRHRRDVSLVRRVLLGRSGTRAGGNSRNRRPDRRRAARRGHRSRRFVPPQETRARAPDLRSQSLLGRGPDRTDPAGSAATFRGIQLGQRTIRHDRASRLRLGQRAAVQIDRRPPPPAARVP